MMPTLERLRALYPDAPPPVREVRERARLALVAHAEKAARRPRLVRRALLPAVGLAIVALAAAAALVGVANDASIDARAAAVLHKAAASAKARPAVGRGPILYVRSVDAYLSVWPEQGWAVLEPHERELWVGPDGAGRLRNTTKRSRFLSEHDRRNWIAAGRPELPTGNSDDRIPPAPGPELPTDPDALYAQLEKRAEGHSEGTYPEMFTLIGDAFRGTNITQEQRAALFEVVARIPGVKLVGKARDPVGRRGVAVGMDHPRDGMRHTLIIDPETGTLLSEQQVVLEKNAYGYPAGTVVGHSTYLVTAMVPTVGARPK